MKNDDFINFETAKIARIIGFDLDAFACYDEEGGFINGLYDCNFTVCNHNKYDETYSAPLKSDLQKWLIDNYKIFVNVDVVGESLKFEWFIHDLSNNGEFIIESDEFHNSYNEALEIGLRYGLLHILSINKEIY